MPEEARVSAIEEYSAVRAMMDTKGWAVLQKKISEEGEELMSAVLDIGTSKDERELKLRELEGFKRIPKIIDRMRIYAEAESEENKEPK